MQLEANIVADGCRDPLVVWRQPTFSVTAEDGTVEILFYDQADVTILWDEKEGGYEYRTWETEDDEITEGDWPHILIDGHNRHEICSRLGLLFETVAKAFASRDEATEWIINNQFGRRNLSDYQRGVLALRMKPIIEARALARQQGGQGGVLLSPISDEATSDIFTSEVQMVAPVEPAAPIRTDAAVASLANLGKDTIRKIEQIEQQAVPGL